MSNTELNKQAGYLDHILTIKQFFNRHRSGGYIFAISYSYALKKEVNLEIIEYCKEINLKIGEAKIEFQINETPTEQLDIAKEEFPNGLILINIDELMLTTQNEFAYQLNQMREALFALHIPILIWLTPENHVTFTHKAIDLYTRRDLDTIFFPELKLEAINHIIERSEMKLGQYEDSETLRIRIVLLENQLQAARNDIDIPRSRIVKEIVLPLIKAYRQLILLPQALDLVEEFKNDLKENDRDLLFECGKLYYQLGNLNNAIDYFEQALQIDKMVCEEDSFNIISDYNELGIAWNDMGDFDKAIDYYEKILAIEIKSYGEEFSGTAIQYNNLGTAWQDKDNFDKAISYYNKALEIYLKEHSEENPKIAVFYNNLAGAWSDKRDFDKAINYYNKSLEIDLKLYGLEHPNIATRYNNLGLVWKYKNDLDKAINYYEKALAIDLKLYGKKNPKIGVLYLNLGYAFQAKKEIQKAKNSFEKAYDIFCQTYGLEHKYASEMQYELTAINSLQSPSSQ